MNTDTKKWKIFTVENGVWAILAVLIVGGVTFLALDTVKRTWGPAQFRDIDSKSMEVTKTSSTFVARCLIHNNKIVAAYEFKTTNHILASPEEAREWCRDAVAQYNATSPRWYKPIKLEE